MVIENEVKICCADVVIGVILLTNSLGAALSGGATRKLIAIPIGPAIPFIKLIPQLSAILITFLFPALGPPEILPDGAQNELNE